MVKRKLTLLLCDIANANNRLSIKGSGTYPYTILSNRFLTEVYKNTKINTSA